MLARNGAGSNHCSDNGGPRKAVATGERRLTSKTEAPDTQAIRAELHGSAQCSALALVAVGSSPVLALCRELIDAGHDPSAPLTAYRGDVECLRIRAIGEAAGLEVNAKGTGFIRHRAVRPASPMRSNMREAV